VWPLSLIYFLGKLWAGQLMIICEHHDLSEHYQWLVGEENQHQVYCITRSEVANMQAISIVSSGIM
jgi:hypothetical protein